MNGDDMGSGLAGLLISNLYLVAGFIAVLVLGAVAYWFGAWTIVDARPSFEDTLGRVLGLDQRRLVHRRGTTGRRRGAAAGARD